MARTQESANDYQSINKQVSPYPQGIMAADTTIRYWVPTNQHLEYTMTRHEIVVMILLCTIMMLLIIRITLVEHLADLDDPIAQIREETSQYHKENARLEQQILHFESYTTIASEAGKLELKEPQRWY